MVLHGAVQPVLYCTVLYCTVLSRVGRHVWYCMELCGLGPVSDVAAALTRIQRRLNEDQIAYIIKEVRLCVVKCGHCSMVTTAP